MPKGKRPALWKLVRAEIEGELANGFDTRDDAVRRLLMGYWPGRDVDVDSGWERDGFHWSADMTDEVVERAVLRALRLIYKGKLDWRKPGERT